MTNKFLLFNNVQCKQYGEMNNVCTVQLVYHIVAQDYIIVWLKKQWKQNGKDQCKVYYQRWKRTKEGTLSKMEKKKEEHYIM